MTTTLVFDGFLADAGDPSEDLGRITIIVKGLPLESPTFKGASLGDGRLSLYFGASLSPADVETVNAAMLAYTPLTLLERAKQTKCAAIDARTDVLVERGFVYEGKSFFLSLGDRVKLMGLFQMKDHPLMAYPVVFSTRDNTDMAALSDAGALEAFYLAGMGCCRVCTDRGIELKALIRAATTIAEVDAVEDDR